MTAITSTTNDVERVIVFFSYVLYLQLDYGKGQQVQQQQAAIITKPPHEGDQPKNDLKEKPRGPEN